MTGTRRIVAGDAAEGLARIGDPHVDLAIWHRRPAPAIVRWLAQIPPEALPQGRVLVHRSALDAALAALFDASMTPATMPARALADDVAMLARCFAALARTDAVDVRLEAVSGDSCWKFHRDRVAIRLLATYLGPGTQWVPESAAGAALDRQRAYAGPLGQLPRFAVGVFRGCDGDTETGMLHRSPPVAGSGVVRLLLAVSPPSAASPPLWAPGQPVAA